MNGILIVNKPLNCTSHDIVYKVKKIAKSKVGHTGTLDPMASGVLPLLIGRATLCSKYFVNHDKIYNVQLKLGIKTETADQEGKILEKAKVDSKILEEKNVKEKLQTFLGKQFQKPPIYSAIKVNGKKLYEYARKNEEVEIPTREITIYEIKLNNVDAKNNVINFTVHCSKGTYIRSLCEDIAHKLGTIGYMAGLERTKVGEFSIEDSVNIDKLDEKTIEKYIIKIEDVLKKYENINISEIELKKLLNGVKLKKDYSDGIYKIYCKENFIGTGTIKNKFLKRDVII